MSFIYWSTVSYIFKQLDHHIEYDNQSLQSLYATEGYKPLVDAINERLSQYSYDSIYLLYDKDKKILAGNLTRIPYGLDQGWHILKLRDLTPIIDQEDHSARIIITHLSDNLVLINGLDIDSAHQQEHMILNSLLIGIAIVLLLGAIGGFIIGITTVKKINIINQSIWEVREGNLSIRIPSKGTDDEYDLLSDNINQMLDQIQSLMTGIKNISNNIAHDLRTPLTRLRSHLEIIQNSSNDKDNIADAISETDSILSTFNALLRINNVESGSQKGHFSTLKINSLLEDIISFYEPVAANNNVNIQLNSSDNTQFIGDRDMLFQAIANLLDNAIKYSPNNTTIIINTNMVTIDNNKRLEITISDNGIGISDKEKSKVFDLFYRSEKHRDHKGNGLGLSLVSAIISLHKGEVTLKDNNPGLTVRIHLPI
ncbi:MAG: HAMP domain-containing sensor histidine kinase [Methylococcales bacterium]